MDELFDQDRALAVIEDTVPVGAIKTVESPKSSEA